MRYRVTRRTAWLTKAEKKKKRSGNPYTEKTADVGKILTEKQLDGADVEALVEKGALEPIEEDGEE